MQIKKQYGRAKGRTPFCLDSAWLNRERKISIWMTLTDGCRLQYRGSTGLHCPLWMYHKTIEINEMFSPGDARKPLPGSWPYCTGRAKPWTSDSELFSSHVSSPVPTNVILLLKARGLFKEIFSIGFGSVPSKGSYINQNAVCSHADFPLPPLASAKHMFSSLSKGEKLHVLSVVQVSKAVLCIFPWPPWKKKDFWHPIRNTQNHDVPNGSYSNIHSRVSFVTFLAYTRSLLAGSAVFSNCSLLIWKYFLD